MIVTLLGLVFDQLIGDPQTKFHPVALIGRLISALEKMFYMDPSSPQYTPRKQLLSGAMVVALTLFIVYDVTDTILWAVGLWGNVYLFYAVQGLILSFMICPKSLAGAAMEIHHYLIHHHLHIARDKVGLIVGRDTAALDEGEVTRATVETVAENTVDGILAPLFFFALGGVPLAAVYRAVNTLDSMIAYKNEKYLYFGRVAARVDDVCNWLPARLGAGFFIVTAFFLRYDWRGAITMIRRDAAKHPSPNGGYAEAAVAGALQVRLGGYNSYFGKMTFRAYMGDPTQPLRPYHIEKAVAMMYGATCCMAVVTMAWCWWW